LIDETTMLRCGSSGQIRVIDVGGGLATNYTDDSISPTFIEYAAALKEHIPELFTTSSSDTDVADVSVATISEEEEEGKGQT
jgi:diaminopimelate decarboxylase